MKVDNLLVFQYIVLARLNIPRKLTIQTADSFLVQPFVVTSQFILLFLSAEIEPCSSDPCVNGGMCISESPFDFSCVCPLGFTGSTCELAMGFVCGDEVCPLGLTCRQQGARFECARMAFTPASTGRWISDSRQEIPCKVLIAVILQKSGG